MASKRRKRRDAIRKFPSLAEGRGMTNELLLAHRELEVIRAEFRAEFQKGRKKVSRKRKAVVRKVALLREAEQINGLHS